MRFSAEPVSPARKHLQSGSATRRYAPPRRIVLTFTPCGRPETLRFIQWLGITVPEEVERAILSSDTPLTESIRACARSLRRILEAGVSRLVPLGVNVESVSIRKEEIAASVDLFHVLRVVVQEFA